MTKKITKIETSKPKDEIKKQDNIKPEVTTPKEQPTPEKDSSTKDTQYEALLTIIARSQRISLKQLEEESIRERDREAKEWKYFQEGQKPLESITDTDVVNSIKDINESLMDKKNFSKELLASKIRDIINDKIETLENDKQIVNMYFSEPVVQELEVIGAKEGLLEKMFK